MGLISSLEYTRNTQSWSEISANSVQVLRKPIYQDVIK